MLFLFLLAKEAKSALRLSLPSATALYSIQVIDPGNSPLPSHIMANAFREKRATFIAQHGSKQAAFNAHCKSKANRHAGGTT
jgi:hypothetical protein